MYVTSRPLTRQFSYVNATNWTALEREVFEHSSAKTLFDELVQLHDARRGRPGLQRSVRRIIFSSLEQIPDLLTPTAAHSGDVANNVISRAEEHYLHDTANRLAQTETERDSSGEDSDPVHNNPPRLSPGDESPMFDDAQDSVAGQSAQRKLDSAVTIANVYSCYALRKKERLSAKMKPADTIHLRYVNEFRATYKWDASMDGPHRRYRLLLVVSLPYGLTVLELAREHLSETRRRLKRRVNAKDHFDHEHYNDTMTQCK